MARLLTLASALGVLILSVWGYFLLPDTFPDANTVYELERLFLTTTALVVALYALFARDERLRVNSENAFVTFIGFAAATFLGVITMVLRTPTPSAPIAVATRVFAYLSVLVYLASFLFLLFSVFMRAYNRLYNLRENKMWKYFKPVRIFRRRFGPKKTYEYSDLEQRQVPPGSFGPLEPFFPGQSRDVLQKGASVLLLGPSAQVLTAFAIDLVAARLKAGDTANYICADRHPFELWPTLTAKASDLPRDHLVRDFIFIDAFTEVFGFTDDIHEENTRKLTEAEGVAVVTARTLAGIHTATNIAFNIIKEREQERRREKRRPMVVIYAFVSSLILTESKELLGIFWKHVLPSERSYGMVTLVLEHDTLASDVRGFVEPLIDRVLEWDSATQSFKPATR